MAVEEILNYLGSNSGNSLLSGVAGGLLTNEAYKRLSDIGDTAYERSMDLADRGQQESQFRPFTVTTPTGSAFTARMGGQPQPPMMTGGPVPPPPGMPFLPQPKPITYGNETTDRWMRENLPQPIQPVTGGPVAPSFTPVLRSGVMPGTVMDGGGAFGSGQGRQQPTPQPQPQGGLEIGMSLSPEEQSMYEGLFGGAGQFFGQAQQPTAGREQEIFNRMRAAQMPEEQRQRLALEERLAAQGRLGTSSAAYGGATPEMLAMATAQEEGRNRAMLGAMQQAQAEQMQQASLGQQFLGSSYLPQQQLLAALQPGLTQQQMAQQAQQFGTGLFSETAMSGIESKLIAEQARANLLGGIGSNVLSGLMTPQFNKDGDITSPGGLGSSIKGFADLVTKLFGK